jgi:hypothetical protein
MPTSPHIENFAREYIAREVVPLLPVEVGALTLEIVAWHITIHAYQYEVLSDLDFGKLDAAIEALARVLPPRKDEPWWTSMAWHRVKRGEPPQYEGEVLYEGWAKL